MCDVTKCKKLQISKGKSNHGSNKLQLRNADQDPVPKQTETNISVQNNRTCPASKKFSRCVTSNISKCAPSTSAPKKSQSTKCCPTKDETPALKVHCNTCQCKGKNMLVVHGKVLSDWEMKKIIPERYSQIHSIEEIIPDKIDVKNVLPKLAPQKTPHCQSPTDGRLQIRILENSHSIELEVPLNENFIEKAPLQSLNHLTQLEESEERVLAVINPEKESKENVTDKNNVPVENKDVIIIRTPKPGEIIVPVETEPEQYLDTKSNISEEKISVERFVQVETKNSQIPVEAALTEGHIDGKKPSDLKSPEEITSDELAMKTSPAASTHDEVVNDISPNPTRMNETGDKGKCGCQKETSAVNEDVNTQNETEDFPVNNSIIQEVVAVDTKNSQIPVEETSRTEAFDPILKSSETITPAESSTKEVLPREETVTRSIKCLQHCHCINDPSTDENLIHKDILPRATTEDDESPEVSTTASLGEILPVKTPTEEIAKQSSTREASHEKTPSDEQTPLIPPLASQHVKNISPKPTGINETGYEGNCGCLQKETSLPNKPELFPVDNMFIQSSEEVVAVDEYSTEKMLASPHSTGYLEIGEKEYTCVSEQCRTENLEQNARCCESMTNRSILKLELEKGDEPDKYLLLHGPIFVRKSLLSQAPTLEPLPQKIEPTESDTVRDFLNCKKCCREGKCVAKELLHICQSDPEGIIEMYRSQIIDLPCIKEEKLLSDTFQMQKTHGEVYGDPKYHFLMVDKSVSVDEMMLGQEKTEVEEEEEIIEGKKPEEENLPEIEVVSKVDLQITNAELSIEPSKEESELKVNRSEAARTSAVSWGAQELLKRDIVVSDDSLDKVADETRKRRERSMRSSLPKKKKNSAFEVILRKEKNKNTPLPLDDSSKNVLSLSPGESEVDTKCCGIKKKRNKSPSDQKWSTAHRNSNIVDINKYDVDPDASMTSVQYPSKPPTGHSSDRSSLNSYRRRSSPVENPVFEKHKRMSKYLNNV